MNRTISTLIITSILILIAGNASAVVGKDCPEGAMCMTSGGDTPTSTNTSDNSTLQKPDPGPRDPQATLTVTSRSCGSGSHDRQLTKGDYTKAESYPPIHSMKFNGTVVTATPCMKLDYNITEEGGVYTMNIYSAGRGDEGACVDCVGAVRYNASFRVTGEYFQLNIQHNGKDITSFAPPQKINEGGLADKPNQTPSKPGKSPEDHEEDRPKKKSFFTGIANWFNNLF